MNEKFNEKINTILEASLDKAHTDVCIEMARLIDADSETIEDLEAISARHKENKNISKEDFAKRSTIYLDLLEKAEEKLDEVEFTKLTHAISNTDRYM